MYVPVVDKDQNPLMPTKPQKASKWIRQGKATGFWKKGVFCVRLNIEPSARETQPICIGIDPGSKCEGFTVKSEAHTFLNMQIEAVTWVKNRVKTRRIMRGARRSRKTPCRANRQNRAKGGIPPSIKARWQWKLRLCDWLNKMYPITNFVVEDVKAKTKGLRCWDQSFTPLEVGKHWFYNELGKIAPVKIKQGYKTKELRDMLGLEKTSRKLAEIWEAHCVDSWCLANWLIGGHTTPDNKDMLCIKPIKYSRRQLHMLQPIKGGIRKKYGGSISNGFKKASLVKHTKHGLCYIGGSGKTGISLHCLKTGKRLCQNAKIETIRFLSFNTYIRRWVISPQS